MRVSSSPLGVILALALLACAVVFTAAFRYAVREQAWRPADLPEARARLMGPDARARWRWRRVPRAHIAGRLSALQATIIALGVTAVFVMFLCVAGGLAAVIIGS